MKKFLQAVILYENNEIHIIHEFNVGVINIQFFKNKNS